ncbi:hypothetical protein B2J93_5442 [Marssonina coronariae]|uniref:Uncharacterized protein n=1 Tax=Diplocarpon coronariae TaxID=2795749 RepID=A0A218Z091_9HELO|nr:hypothetical protein B2J93_5442 [Marssonina coronariae]
MRSSVCEYQGRAATARSDGAGASPLRTGRGIAGQVAGSNGDYASLPMGRLPASSLGVSVSGASSAPEGHRPPPPESGPHLVHARRLVMATQRSVIVAAARGRVDSCQAGKGPCALLSWAGYVGSAVELVGATKRVAWSVRAA